jgi:hypothetical protein
MSLSRTFLAKKLSRPLPTKDGGILRTIAEARAYMVALPPERELSQHWQRPCRLLLEQADVGTLTWQVQLALAAGMTRDAWGLGWAAAGGGERFLRLADCGSLWGVIIACRRRCCACGWAALRRVF